MFCYISADYFGLYKPGALQRMLEGKMGPLQIINVEIAPKIMFNQRFRLGFNATDRKP